MAIVMIHDVSDGTLAEYDQVIRELKATAMGIRQGGSPTWRRARGPATSSSMCGSHRRPLGFGQILVPLLERAGGRVPAPAVLPGVQPRRGDMIRSEPRSRALLGLRRAATHFETGSWDGDYRPSSSSRGTPGRSARAWRITSC